MGELEKRSVINKMNLKRGQYFQSLLYEASRLNVIEVFKVKKIQLDLYTLLAKQVNRYTSGDSTSVTIERAQQLLQSICYCISVYLKSAEDVDLQLKALNEETIESMFNKGQNLIKACLKKSKGLLEDLQKNALSVDNYAYKDTIFKGIPDFFYRYDYRYETAETSGSIDYPLSKDDMDLSGIEYIAEYLEHITMENDFCNKFSHESIESLLMGYGEAYKEDLINIYELVLTNALGAMVLSKDLADLNITEADIIVLKQKFRNTSEEQILDIFTKAFNHMCSMLNLSNSINIDYLKKALIPFSKRLRKNLDLNRLENLFITFKQPLETQEPYYQHGDPMQDSNLRELIERIRACEKLTDKVMLVQNHVKSLVDLVEILPECFYEGEFEQVFKLLSEFEISELSKYITQQRQMDNDYSEYEQPWEKALIHYKHVAHERAVEES